MTLVAKHGQIFSQRGSSEISLNQRRNYPLREQKQFYHVMEKRKCVSIMIKLTEVNIHNINNSDEFIFQKASYIKKLDSYTLRKGDHLSYTRVREIVLEKLGKKGLNTSKLGLYSLRSGGATQAANSGVCDRLFKKHGRWKSESATDRYVKEDDNITRSVH